MISAFASQEMAILEPQERPIRKPTLEFNQISEYCQKCGIGLSSNDIHYFQGTLITVCEFCVGKKAA